VVSKNWQAKIEGDAETHEVCADVKLLECPAAVLIAQRNFFWW
jgi:hypothetical protein